MLNFFKLLFKRGLQLIAIIVALYLLYIVLNFLFPNTINKVQENTKNFSITSLKEKPKSLRDQIYKLFFGSNQTASSSDFNILKRRNQNRGENSPFQEYFVWGGSNTEKLDLKANYFFPEDNLSIVKNFTINNKPVFGKEITTISSGDVITIDIAKFYLDSFFFNLEFYDYKGDYLFSIPGNTEFNQSNPDIAYLTVKYLKIYNTKFFSGKGILVLRSTNPKIDGTLIINAKIED